MPCGGRCSRAGGSELRIMLMPRQGLASTEAVLECLAQRHWWRPAGRTVGTRPIILGLTGALA